MKIDIVKIAKINKKIDLKKYSINKPIFLENYLFHYLIFTDNLKGLKLTKYPIYKINNEGYNGIHLAAHLENYHIVQYLLKQYPEYIYNLTATNENFLHFFSPNNKNYLNLFLKNKKLNWNQLIQQTSKNCKNNLEILMNSGTIKQIMTILKMVNVKFDNFEEIPAFFKLLYNDNLTNQDRQDILNYIEKKNKDILKITDNMGSNLIFAAIINDNLVMTKFLIKKGLEIDYYTPVNTYNSFKTAYFREHKGLNKTKIAKLIWNKIKENHNFNETNKYGENLAYFVLNFRLLTEKGNYKLEKEILSKNDQWNLPNIDKNTSLHLIVQLNFNKYKYLLKDKKLDINYKNKNNQTPIDLASSRWTKYITKLSKSYTNKEKKNDKLKLINSKYTHSNLFQALFSDIAIFAVYLDKKYNQLYLPKYNKNEIKNIVWDEGIILPDNFLSGNLRFPWVIIWNDEDNYWIHSYLNQLINSVRINNKYDLSFVFLSIKLPSGGLHANIIIYDFKKNTVERFDPYGNTIYIDNNLDDILEEELTWNTGLSYLGPAQYMPVAGLQTLSDETNSLNQKNGDFGGFCLAWCIWYLEHRISNQSITQKELLKKTRKKLISSDNTIMEYIRNYADKINKQRTQFLKKLDIPEKYISNQILSPKHYLKIYQYINDNM